MENGAKTQKQNNYNGNASPGDGGEMEKEKWKNALFYVAKKRMMEMPRQEREEKERLFNAIETVSPRFSDSPSHICGFM